MCRKEWKSQAVNTEFYDADIFCCMECMGEGELEFMTEVTNLIFSLVYYWISSSLLQISHMWIRKSHCHMQTWAHSYWYGTLSKFWKLMETMSTMYAIFFFFWAFSFILWKYIMRTKSCGVKVKKKKNTNTAYKISITFKADKQ